MYLLFGVLTTAVGWGVKFTILGIWKTVFNIPPEDIESQNYWIGTVIAQIVQWVAAVLFAFFTNRKWVFTDADKNVSVPVQLAKFAGGRVATGVVEMFGTPLCTMAIGAIIPVTATTVFFLWNLAEFLATAGIAVIVIVCNYIFSKIFVFKNKKNQE